MKNILLLGTTVAFVFGIVQYSRRTRENQLMREKLQLLQDRFRSLDRVS